MGDRSAQIVDTLVDAFSDLMAADPAAFRTKFRKMAADPFAFYRGSACLFYADVADLDDPWADERTSRVWIQGDLHAENFGTYMDGDGVLIFDVNDFDEAYLGHFTWDVRRFAASMALLGGARRSPTTTSPRSSRTYARAYLDQVAVLRPTTPDDRELRAPARHHRGRGQPGAPASPSCAPGSALLDAITETEGFDRRLRDGPGLRRLDDDERAEVVSAFERYVGTIPEAKRYSDVAYTIKDVAGRSGFGIGSAGLPAYTVLIEGFNQALDNDVVLSMKQGNVAAPSRVVTDPEIARATSSTTATARRSRSAPCRRTPTGCSATPTWTGSASS